MSKIIPIILCGGSGTRLWPLSRKSFPKQFAPLAGEQTLLQAAVLRMAGPGFGAPVLVTGHAFRFVVADQLAAIGRPPRAILVEPSARNTAGMVESGAVTAIGCTGSLLRNDAPQTELVAIGLTDIVAVSMADTVLIAHRSCTQEIGAAVALLKQKGARQAERFPQEHRPWGKIETLVPEAGLEIRRLHLHPGASLTTQTHGLRSEHWIVLSGTARVTLDGHTQKLGPNESICVPPGMRHRLENPGVDPLILIEVQTGTATGEADVTRHIEAGSDPASRLTDAA